LQELFTYLDAIRDAYAADDELPKLAFLVARAIADFETALEATLSGYQGVAADAMRDEIESLLLDFAVHPEHADEWLTRDRGVRLRKFSPAKVRDRLIAAGMPPFSDEGWEPADYRGHSESLHVTPRVRLVGAPPVHACLRRQASLWSVGASQRRPFGLSVREKPHRAPRSTTTLTKDVPVEDRLCGRAASGERRGRGKFHGVIAPTGGPGPVCGRAACGVADVVDDQR
jgi:hypothetical protein